MGNNETIDHLENKTLTISELLVLKKSKEKLALAMMDPCDEKLVHAFDNLITYPKSIRTFEEAFDLYKSKLIKGQKRIALANEKTSTIIKIGYQKDWLGEKLIITRTHPKENVTNPFSFDDKISHSITLCRSRTHTSSKDDDLSPGAQLKKIFAFKLEPKSIEIWDFSNIGKKILSYEY